MGKQENSSFDENSDVTHPNEKSTRPSTGVTPTFGGPLKLSGNKLINAVTASATIGFLLFGYDQGVMAGIITSAPFIRDFPANDPAVQGEQRAALLQATYVSLYEVGALLGAAFALFYGNALGRRKMAQLGSFAMIIGTIIQVTAVVGYEAGAQFLVGRILTGVGNGMNTSTLSVWISECSRAHNRGLLVSIEASMIAVGTCISYWLNYGFFYIDTSVSWRFPIAFQIVFAAALMFTVAFLPESPRWLLHHGHAEEGLRVCAALVGAPMDDPASILQRDTIMLAVAQSHALGQIRKRSMLTSGKTQHLRRTLIGASTQFFQQIGGANAIIYFAPVIFEQNLFLTRNLALILGSCTVTVYALGTIISFFTVETAGRRPMFLAGSFAQAISMVIVFACLLPGTTSAAKGAVFGIFLYLGAFGAVWLQLPWLVPAEINPLRTRTNANAVSTMTNWSWNFAIVQITPPLLVAIREYTFLLFGLINLAFIPIIYYTYPETAGRTLEEIDIIFALAYTEKRSYVEVSLNMPKLSEDEIASEAIRLGLVDESLVADGKTAVERASETSTVADVAV